MDNEQKQLIHETPSTNEEQTTLTSHDAIYSFLCNKEDISWQHIIYQAVKSEHMDPWNIDVSLLAQRFLADLQTMKQFDFAVSGKMILAAAILVRLKSNKLVSEDLTYLDQLIASSEQNEENAFYDDLAAEEDTNTAYIKIGDQKFTLTPRTPQPRKRKVSVYDLVEALEKALEVKGRRKIFDREEIQMEIPRPSEYIKELVMRIFNEVKTFLANNGEKQLLFTQLLKEGDRMEKVLTFLPLLHLSNSGKINLHQKEHLGDIGITLCAQE